VQQVPCEAPVESTARPIEPQTATGSEPRSSSRRLLAAGLLVILLGGACILWLRSAHRRVVSGNRTTLAVLPFENLSGEPAQQFFADGFSEEMITQLGGLDPSRLAVIARTSAMHYQGTVKDLREIGRELGAEYVLTGSIRRDGDRVRITARLIRTDNGTHLWAKDYDRGVRDILVLQSEVASAIAGEVSLQLSPEKTARLAAAHPVDPEAYESYLKGRYFWNKRTAAAYGKAIEYFNDAIARDPKYAQAYTGLADAYALLGSLPDAQMPRPEAMPKARAAALTALQLDDSLAEAHTSLAFEELQYEWNWPQAEREFKTALQLNSNYATAHQWYALWFVSRGQTDEALDQLSQAEKADPLSIIIKCDISEMLTTASRYEQAAAAARRALDLEPDFPLAHLALADAYAGQQKYPQAIAEYQKILATDNGYIWARAGLARCYARNGQRADAEKLLQETLRGCGNRGSCPAEVSSIYGGLGEKEQEFAWLEKAYQIRDGGLFLLNAHLSQSGPHPDARYVDLVRRIESASSDGKLAGHSP
jgi:TolB-like protein/Tfp pilus assembly protein PilF